MTNNLIGTQLGKYEIQAELGRGGMATVYRAYQESLNRHVAVKVLAGQLAHDGDFRQRFEREAKAVAQLDHPNILPIYDYGEDQQRDVVYFVTQLVEGGTLSQRMGQPLPIAEAVRIASGVAQALDCAHHHGIIHRDVKPSNILLTEDGRPLLSDFGIARIVQETHLTRTGTSLGTPQYMSPEQAKGEPLDFRADIYSLAVVLYEMLVGRPPFQADTDIAVLHQQVYEPPPPPRQLRSDIPRRLEKVILKALAKDPAKRYPTAGAMAQALERALPSRVSPLQRRPAPVTPAYGAKVEPATIIQQRGAGTASRVAPQPQRRVGRFLWRMTKWISGKVAAAVVILALVAAVLLIGGAFTLSSLLEQTLAAQDWAWEGWEAGGVSIIPEADIQQSLQDAVEPYALDALTNLSADFDPPDIVKIHGQFRQRPLELQALLGARDGVLYIQLERLNGVPLYVVGGIISNGINRGLDSAWAKAPVQLSALEVQDNRIRAVLEPRPGFSPPPPTLTPTPPTAVIHIVNELDCAVTVTLGGKSLKLDAGEGTEIELPAGSYIYAIYAPDHTVTTGWVTWTGGYREWIINE